MDFASYSGFTVSICKITLQRSKDDTYKIQHASRTSVIKQLTSDMLEYKKFFIAGSRGWLLIAGCRDRQTEQNNRRLD